MDKDIIYINYLHKILNNKTIDGYHPALKIDGIHSSEDRNEIANILINELLKLPEGR